MSGDTAAEIGCTAYHNYCERRGDVPPIGSATAIVSGDTAAEIGCTTWWEYSVQQLGAGSPAGPPLICVYASGGIGAWHQPSWYMFVT